MQDFLRKAGAEPVTDSDPDKTLRFLRTRSRAGRRSSRKRDSRSERGRMKSREALHRHRRRRNGRPGRRRDAAPRGLPNVRVYEQASRFARIGAGIQMMPNSMKVLRGIGVEERLRRIAFAPYSHLNRVWDTGEVTIELPMPESSTARRISACTAPICTRRSLRSCRRTSSSSARSSSASTRRRAASRCGLPTARTRPRTS